MTDQCMETNMTFFSNCQIINVSKNENIFKLPAVTLNNNCSSIDFSGAWPSHFSYVFLG